MFFYLSKILWTFAQPISVIGLLLMIATVTGILNRRRLSLGATIAALAIFGLLSWTTVGSLMLLPLEQRFQRPAELPEQIAGIVVLGGAFDGGINSARGLYELTDAADRMTEAAILALRYPNAKLMIAGGSGTILRERADDAETAPLFFEKLGVPRSRLLLDDKSRNSLENAIFARELAQPVRGEIWLLVTSAFHMPRSMALFRQAGFDVVAWPVDYRTAGDESFGGCRDVSASCLRVATLALREWVGLIVYWLTGKIESPLPGPELNRGTAKAG